MNTDRKTAILAGGVAKVGNHSEKEGDIHNEGCKW